MPSMTTGDRARGRLRQRMVGSLPSCTTDGWVVVPRTVELARVVGRDGRPSPLIDIDAFAIFSSRLLPVFVAEAVRSCGNPGRRMVSGISNGYGKVWRWTGGGPELSIPGQLPQPGRGAASPAAEAASWTRSVCIQVCVRTFVAASGVVCRPACGFAWPILRPPPPSSPSDSLPRGVGF